MFGIFGRNLPTAQQLLNPFNMAGFPMTPAIFNPFSYVPPMNPVAPVNPATLPPQQNTTYTDYRKFNFGNPTAGLKIPTGSVIPAGGMSQLPNGWTPQKGVVFKPMTGTDIMSLIKSINANSYNYIPKSNTKPVAKPTK